MDCKYLNDGRKVSVVGKLNTQETIVQEIFVTKDGSEIPSGENFVVKSLHDEPVESYAAREAASIKRDLEKLKQEAKDAERKRRACFQELEAMQEIVKQAKKFVKLLPESELDVFSKFMTGTVEYLVSANDIRKPMKMIDRMIYWENKWGERRFRSIKLCSVFGQSNGKLEYRIHQYSDGSGGTGSVVIPFSSLKDAIMHVKGVAIKRIEEYFLDPKDFDKCIEMGIEFSEEHLDKYNAQVNSRTLKQIKELEKDIEGRKNTLMELREKVG
jgi:hypothetical protein